MLLPLDGNRDEIDLRQCRKHICALLTGSVMLSRARFRETAAQQIRKQLQLLPAELPLPPENDSSLAFMAAAGFGSHVLEDDQDDDLDQASTSTYCVLICAEATCQYCMCWCEKLRRLMV